MPYKRPRRCEECGQTCPSGVALSSHRKRNHRPWTTSYQRRARAMEEIHRVLAPGGVLYLKVPYKEKGPYNPFHYRVFNEDTFTAWVAPLLTDASKQNFTEHSLQNRFGYFRRQHQQIVTLYGFPVWHVIHHLPWTEGILFTRDERGPYSPHIPAVPWSRYRELREWLVKV